MKKVKDLVSRYKDVQTSINQVEDKEYVIVTNGNFSRCLLGEDNNSITSVDFEGGPMLSIGETIEDIGEIKEIRSAYIFTIK